MQRRKLLKYSGLVGLGIISSPAQLWSNKLQNAVLNGREYILKNDSIMEYAPLTMPKLSTLKARLHWNENPFGPSKTALRSFKQSAKKGNFYSWDDLSNFTNRVAEKEGVNSNNIMTGPGSSDLLEKVAITLFKNGGNVIAADPCYMSLVNVVFSMNGKWESVKLNSNFEHDLDKMESKINSETKLIYITNPNNPTATVTNRKKLYDFCEKVSKKVPVFIDEAYLEISDGGLRNSMASLVSKGRDVIVSRTFSKIYGMAGFRMGYIIASEKRLSEINKITRGGMGITGPTIHAAMKSIDDINFLDGCKERLVNNRNFTVNQLLIRGYDPMPSQTNFIIFELPKSINPSKFLTNMYNQKVSVKVMKFWEKDWCRVSIGTLENMETFIKAFDRALI